MSSPLRLPCDFLYDCLLSLGSFNNYLLRTDYMSDISLCKYSSEHVSIGPVLIELTIQWVR